MNSTTISISINASWLEGEALQQWASILKRAFERRYNPLRRLLGDELIEDACARRRLEDR